MQMNAATGVILGTPPVAGTYPVNVTVTDIKNMTATQTFSLVVNPTAPPLVVSPASLQFTSMIGGDVPGPQNLTITVPYGRGDSLHGKRRRWLGRTDPRMDQGEPALGHDTRLGPGQYPAEQSILRGPLRRACGFWDRRRPPRSTYPSPM